MKRGTVVIQILDLDDKQRFKHIEVDARLIGPWAIHRVLKSGNPPSFTSLWQLTHQATGLAVTPATWRYKGWRLTEAQALAAALDDPAWAEITSDVVGDGKHPVLQAAFAQWQKVLAKLHPEYTQ